jgi:hypothetical protein
MKRTAGLLSLAILACVAWASAARGEVLAEYTYSDDENFNPMAQGWTLAEGTEEDVNFFNQAGTSLLMNIGSGTPRPLITKTVPTSAFSGAWTLTGKHRFAGNNQEEFGYFIFADDGTNLWHMSFYNHGLDDFDGIYMGGDPEGPVLSNTATKVWAEIVGPGPGGTAENKPFDGFHDYSLVDSDGAGGAAPFVQLDGVALDPVVMAVPAPSRFPAGTIGWGSLNPNEAGFMQTQHIVFEASEALPGKPGDFNGDNSVGGADFLLWQRNVGAADETSLNGNGDNMNGVGSGDLTLWKNNFGMSGATPAITGVPEPHSLSLLIGTIGVLGFRRRRR